MKRKYYFIITILTVTIVLFPFIKRQGLFQFQQYRYESIIEPIFVAKNTSRGQVGFQINDYLVVCSNRIIRCDFYNQVKKVNHIDLIISYRRTENIDVVSEAYIKKISFIDTNGSFRLISFSDKEINKFKYQRFMNTKGVFIFSIIMFYIGIIFYFWNFSKKGSIPIITILGLIFIIVFYS